jgi:hypothetical protein
MGKYSKYKGVSKKTANINKPWKISKYNKMGGRSAVLYFESEREAALEYDKYLLSIGKEPVNILIRKHKDHGSEI